MPVGKAIRFGMAHDQVCRVVVPAQPCKRVVNLFRALAEELRNKANIRLSNRQCPVSCVCMHYHGALPRSACACSSIRLHREAQC